MLKNVILGIILLIVLLIAGFFILPKIKSQVSAPTIAPSSITNFDECAQAGYPIMDSYPEQCAVPGGQTFTRDIGNEMDYSDEIRVHTPRPNTSVSSPLLITGEARGTWYFEANFSAELVDSDGDKVGSAIVEAQEDWMTEEFVPFRATLTYTKPSTKQGTLILRNANASGLPEKDKTLRIPVTFN